MSKLVVSGQVIDTERISGKDLGILVSIEDLYSYFVGENLFKFRIKSIESDDTILVEWLIETHGGFPPINSEFTVLERGILGGEGNEGIYDASIMRSGYLDIDNIIFDLVENQICNWDWTGNKHLARWKVNGKKIPIQFKHKRPILRKEYKERTLGDKEDSTEITHPYLVFYPLSMVSRFEDWPKIEQWQQFIPDPNATGDATKDFSNLELYEAPKAYDFTYQITGVTDNWKDLELLRAHLDNALFPEIFGERIVKFPSGFTQKLTINQGEVLPIDERGIFEYSIDVVFTLPLVMKVPELTHMYLEMLINISTKDEVNGTIETIKIPVE